MPIPSTINDLSTDPASNSPAGSDSPTGGDNYLRAIQAIMRQEHDDLLNATASTAGDARLGWAAIYDIRDGVLTRHATLAAAVSAISSTRCTVVVRDDVTMAASATFPTTATLRVENKARITTTGYTLTVNGRFECDRSQCFAGSGTVLFGPGAVEDVMPEWWGAVADDTTVCDAPLLSAIKAAACIEPSSAYLYPAATISFGPGSYLLTGNNPLGNVDWTTLTVTADTRYFLRFRGQGLSSRLHWKPTGAAERWLYDNGTTESSDNRWAYCEVSELHVWMDPSGLSAGGSVNGFRLFGDTDGAHGVTQSLRLHRSRFACLEAYDSPSATEIAKAGTLIKCLGDSTTMANADATKVDSCSIRGLGTAFYVDNNDESVSHVFVNTDMEAMFGDVFVIMSGGSLNVLGGSVTMNSEGAAKYLLSYPATDRQLAGTNNFYGIRLECNKDIAGTGNYSGILNIDQTGIGGAYTSDIAVTNFVGCNFYPISRTAGNTINLDSATKMIVNFIGCDGLDQAEHGLRWHSSLATRALTDQTGTICNFRDGTAVPADDVTYDDADSIGRTTARGCRNALDYDLSRDGRGHTSFGQNNNPKTVFLRRADGKWPDVGGTTALAAKLPLNALIIGYGFRKKAAADSGGSNYSLAFMDGAANQLPSSATTPANMNTEHKIVVVNSAIVTKADGTGFSSGVSCDQTVYLACVGAHTGSNQQTAMDVTDAAWITYL